MVLAIGIFSGAIVIFSFRRPAAASASPNRIVSRETGSRAARALSADPLAKSPLETPALAAAVSSGEASAELLKTIRLKLRQLGEISRADKGAEDGLMTSLLALLTDENAAQIVQSLTPAELNSPFGWAALQRWLKADVERASAWVGGRVDVSQEQAWTVAHALAEDRNALQNYCDRLPATSWREMFFRTAAREILWQDPIEAIELARQMRPGTEQTDVLRAAAYAWATREPSAVSDWIAQIADPRLREQLVCSGAEARAASDPLLALQWLTSAIPQPSSGSEELMSDTLQTVVALWTETDPAEAAGLVARFSAGDIRDRNVSAVSVRWLQLDPVAARTWIETLPESAKILASETNP